MAHEYEQQPEDRRIEERRRRERERESRAGWGGQGFNQGSFGSYGGQGERLHTRYGGQGYGAEHGYTSRETGGGMSAAPRRDPGDYGWGGGMGSSSYEAPDRNREEWGREWGGPGFSGREGGWGGYGSYDRERGSYREGLRGYGSTDYAPYGEPSRYRGQHTGRGPKGWRRSDDRIREDVCERLTDHPDIDASDIEIEVQNGEVRLRGTVDRRETKRMAEDVAESVSGVADVHNEIHINRGFWGSVKDALTGGGDESETQRSTGAPVNTITPGPEQQRRRENEPVSPRK